MKKHIILIAIIGLLLLVLPLVAYAGIIDGWEWNNGHIFYYTDGTYLVGNQTIDGIQYCFNENGQLQGNGKRQKCGDDFYYIIYDQTNGPVTAQGEYYIEDGTYYFGSYGKMETGWKSVDHGEWITGNYGNRYNKKMVDVYFGPDGKRVEDCLYTIGENTYYFSSNGEYVKEQYRKIDGDFYRFDDQGIMIKNAWHMSGITSSSSHGSVYYYFYFGSDGKALHEPGWQIIDGETYYFVNCEINSYPDYSAATGRVNIDESYYYFLNNSGRMLKNEKIDSYYYGDDGKEVTGFVTIDNVTYYFSPKQITRTGAERINGNYYYFSAGRLEKGWYTIKTYTCYSNEDGICAYGFTMIDGNLYYFIEDGYEKSTLKKNQLWSKKNNDNITEYYYSDENGIVQTNYWRGLSYFDENGKRVKGWKVIDGNTYYFGNDGPAVTGQIDILDDLTGEYSHYYFDDKGKMQTGFIIGSGGQISYAGDDGKFKTGWQTINGDTYYFGSYYAPVLNPEAPVIYYESEYIMKTGFLAISDNGSRENYLFDENGKMLTGIQTIGNNYFSFASDGKMERSSMRTDTSGRLYYFGDTGYAVTGWYTIDNKTYYFAPEALTDGMYYLDRDGVIDYYQFNQNSNLVEDNDTNPELLEQEQDILASASQTLNSLAQLTSDNAFMLQNGYYPLHISIINNTPTIGCNDTLIIGYAVTGGKTPIGYSGIWEIKQGNKWVAFEHVLIEANKGVACMKQMPGNIRFRIDITDADNCTTSEYSSVTEVEEGINNKSFLILPKNLLTIEDEAFMNMACSVVIIPDGCLSIGSKAFANCENLTRVIIPSSVISIADNAFEGCGENLIIDRID